ncbi:MAG TPA: VWA domain-containing protein [Thermoanaerobaculia bacterium]|nr:VWA domain-containing protein [Thermoanaerobaculia bacterium]
MAVLEKITRVASRNIISTLLALLLFIPNPVAAMQRLILDQNISSVPSTQFTGSAEITVVPPFEGARLTVSIDGQLVAAGLRSPYQIQVDFGPAAIEHKIAVTAASSDGRKKIHFSRTVNQGERSLSVKIEEVEPGGALFEAMVTAPASDPIVKVAFYDQDGLLREMARGAYRIEVPDKSRGGLLQVTATAKSGIEVSDFFGDAGEIHVESYDVRTMKLFVSVTDRTGSIKTDIPASTFKVLDNGVKGKILDVGKALEEPVSIAILVDASASMTPWMKRARAAANSFVQKIVRPADRYALFAIQSVPRRQLALTNTPAALDGALANLHAHGETALYDAIESALRELEGERNRRAIVILSDGEDTSSFSSYDEILKKAVAAGVTIYVIAFAEEEQPQAHIDRLRYLAGQTGGFLTMATSRTLDQRYADIERELREQYAIKYQIAGMSKPNEWRKVRVLLVSPTMTARTISGYFSP